MKNKLIISAVIVAALGVGAFLIFSKQNQPQEGITGIQNATTTSDQKPIIASKDISTWKLFDKIQPTFRYPSNWKIDGEIYARTQAEIDRDIKNGRLNPPAAILVGAKVYPGGKTGYTENDYIRIGGRRVCPEDVKQFGSKAYWKWEDFGGVEKDVLPAPTKHFCDGGVPIDTWSTNPEILEVFDILTGNLSHG